MGFSRQKCWSRLPFPSPGDLPDPRIKPGYPVLRADALPSEPPRKPGPGLVTKPHSTLCDSLDCSTPGSSVLCYLPEFAQIHVHWVDGDIKSSHPLPHPSPLAFCLSQHQGLFQWIGSSHQAAKVLELQLQHQSFQWLFSWFPLGLTGLISLLSKGLSRVFSNITVQKHEFFGPQLSL